VDNPVVVWLFVGLWALAALLRWLTLVAWFYAGRLGRAAITAARRGQ
jgi:hypothetical protein